MKITNAEVIKNGERELIDAITADLDWGAIEDIFLKEHNLGIEEDIEYKKGDIIAFNDQIAYKLEFDVKVNLSVLLDREGEYISVNISGKTESNEADMAEGPIEDSATESVVNEKKENSPESVEPQDEEDDEHITHMENQVEEMMGEMGKEI
jgi:hypothetical protein